MEKLRTAFENISNLNGGTINVQTLENQLEICSIPAIQDL